MRDAFLRPDCPPFAARVPEPVRRLEALPQASGHNDACPQNLPVPAGEPESFVVIDVGYQCPNPIGDDLPPVHEAVIDAHLEGPRLENRAVAREEVVPGCDGMPAVRGAFHSEPELAGGLLERAAAL
ncbi:hypothetical protein V1227_14160 [Lentzea sp. DG1S-22]|uniref:hypothetical protein n=1 Tax=Lentzea sp. DG1S-22 TaxID=3108822 RepID=UPI002E77FC7C|nr:hypothetical protein [Lentzea sp. DG1S-22]WVH83842.1 hypothetical protein V1227_14160 [Lentzea sp. DG1S-22]